MGVTKKEFYREFSTGRDVRWGTDCSVVDSSQQGGCAFGPGAHFVGERNGAVPEEQSGVVGHRTVAQPTAAVHAVTGCSGIPISVGGRKSRRATLCR